MRIRYAETRLEEEVLSCDAAESVPSREAYGGAPTARVGVGEAGSAVLYSPTDGKKRIVNILLNQ